MHSHCPDSASSPCKGDNSTISFSTEVPIPGDESTLLCHCLQGRHPAPNNSCARLSDSLLAVQVTVFPEIAAFAPVNSGWKAAHIPQQQRCLMTVLIAVSYSTGGYLNFFSKCFTILRILARAVSFFCRSITLALLNFCVSSHLHCSVRLTQVELSADTANTTGGSGNRAARCVRL